MARPATTPDDRPAPAQDTLAALGGRQLIVVTGKGGVGKSAIAAALGRALARAGKKVLLVEVDPRENVHQLLDRPPSGGAVVEAGGGLFLQHLLPRAALDELVREQLSVKMVADRIVASAGYHQLAEGAPGLKEVAVLAYAERRVKEAGKDGFGPFDLVLLDAPATGHGVSLLAAPRLVSEVITEGPVGRRAVGLADFVADRERLGLVVVTLAEEMPTQEALELAASLQERLDRRPELLVINGLYPVLPQDLETQIRAALEELALAGDPGEEERRLEAAGGNLAALAAWYRRRRIQDRELQRLEDHWQGPRVRLPQLPLDRGTELVEALSRRLAAALPGAAA